MYAPHISISEYHHNIHLLILLSEAQNIVYDIK